MHPTLSTRHRNPYTNVQVGTRYTFADSKLPSEGRILDIGCNSGQGFIKLVRTGRFLEGMDKNPQGAGSIFADIRRGDILDAHLPPQHYAGITMLEVLEHLPREEHGDVIGKIAAALTSEGVFVLSTPNGGVIPEPKSTGHISEVHLDELVGLIMANFAHVEIYGYGTFQASTWSSLSRSLKKALCELGIYDTLRLLTPVPALHAFSQAMRGELQIHDLSTLSGNEVALNFIAVATQPKQD